MNTHRPKDGYIMQVGTPSSFIRIHPVSVSIQFLFPSSFIRIHSMYFIVLGGLFIVNPQTRRRLHHAGGCSTHSSPPLLWPFLGPGP